MSKISKSVKLAKEKTSKIILIKGGFWCVMGCWVKKGVLGRKEVFVGVIVFVF